MPTKRMASRCSLNSTGLGYKIAWTKAPLAVENPKEQNKESKIMHSLDGQTDRQTDRPTDIRRSS